MRNVTSSAIFEKIERRTSHDGGVSFRIKLRGFGPSFRMDTGDLVSRPRFLRKFYQATGIYPRLPTGFAFDDFINAGLEKCQ